MTHKKRNNNPVLEWLFGNIYINLYFMAVCIWIMVGAGLASAPCLPLPLALPHNLNLGRRKACPLRFDFQFRCIFKFSHVRHDDSLARLDTFGDFHEIKID